MSNYFNSNRPFPSFTVNATFVSFPTNPLTRFFTKVFILSKSSLLTLPEPSSRNAMSAWLRHSVKNKSQNSSAAIIDIMPHLGARFHALNITFLLFVCKILDSYLFPFLSLPFVRAWAEKHTEVLQGLSRLFKTFIPWLCRQVWPPEGAWRVPKFSMIVNPAENVDIAFAQKKNNEQWLYTLEKKIISMENQSQFKYFKRTAT